MSIRAIGIVLDAHILPPTNKLAAVVLADWCNDDGGSLYPSMNKIAEKVGVSRSQAQRIVHGFIDQGLLSVIANAAGGRPGTTPTYQLHLDKIALLKPMESGGRTVRMDATGSADATGSTHAEDGSHGRTQGVARMRKTGRAGATQSVIEPSVEPSVEPKARTRKAAKTVIPSSFSISGRVLTWAAEKGFTNLEAHLENFVGKAKAKGYTYRDWDEAFMNAIRDDWAGLRTSTGAKSKAAHKSFASTNYDEEA